MDLLVYHFRYLAMFSSASCRINFSGQHHAGLGSNMNDICGRDWFFGGGDHGDPGNFCQVSLFDM